MNARIETGFRDVDGTGETQPFADYLGHVNSIESVAAGKRTRAALLGLGDDAHAIDVGCGLGDDARALSRLVGPRGRVVGVDASAAMLERARARRQAEDGPVEFIAGDAHQLPFDTDSFHAARVERTLQHLDDPARVVGELVRVTRPGGIVLAHEPDWGTLVCTGRPPALVRAMLAAAETQIRHPWVGRELTGMFVDAGLTDVEIVPEVLLQRDLEIDIVIDVPLLATDLRAQRHQGVDELLAATREDSRAGRAVAALTLFTVYGRVP
ncbi:MAG TPA: methyltransferase domain-containing protein [Solirubrobacteraceae bacterium]|nr:methyltransferase domain-containing protein [Solirubrobacteraceae bacterium]